MRRRDFALVWTGGLVSDTGDWLLLIGLPIHVFTVTGSTLATSVVLVVELAPGLLLGSFAGVLVDRWDRRRTMVVTNLVQAVLLLPLVVATSEDRLWIVYAVAGLEAVLARLFNPAKLALVPSLVGPDDLLAANSLMGVNENLARLVGSPLGGVCVATFGLPGVVVVDAASFVVAAALVAGSRPVPSAGPDPGPVGGFAREWLDGLAVVRRSPPLRALVLVAALGQLAQGIFVVLVVVFVVRELGGTGTEVGLLRGVQAVGAIAGGVVIGALGHRFDAARLTAPALVLFGAVSFVTWNAPAATTALGVYVVLFVVVGIPAVAAMSGLMTLVQVNTEPAYLGRVLSTLEAASGAFQVVGLLVAGTLADELGVVAVLNVEAAVWTAAGAVAFFAFHERRPGSGGAARDRAARLADVDATRVDRWLWAVRLCQSRSQATDVCRRGHVRVNGRPAKAATPVTTGDRVEARVNGRDRVVEVTRVIDARVGAPIAVECYVDHSPPPPPRDAIPVGDRDRGAGRPTKRERRQLDRWRSR